MKLSSGRSWLCAPLAVRSDARSAPVLAREAPRPPAHLSYALSSTDSLMSSCGCMVTITVSEAPNGPSLMPAADAAEVDPDSQAEGTFSIGFTDLNVAGLGSKSTPSEERLLTDQQTSSRTENQIAASAMTQEPEPAAASPPQLNSAESSGGLQMSKLQTKADKIKLALEKLREAKVRKLIVKVLMSDGSSKTLMVDERQTVREVLDQLFEKTHCDCSIDWSLCETNPELQIERGFEDHEHLVEPLSLWTRLSENKIYFLLRPQKYVMFTEPQEHFGGSTLIVPDLQGMLYLKEDGKKLWKPRYFVLRASGIYYVPKGKTKSSSDLACFVHFEKVNIYTTNNFKQKYRAPTNFCFMLKYGTVLYKNYQAAIKRTSSLQTVHFNAHKGKYNSHTRQISPQPSPAAPKTTNVEDYPHEPPPDFIPLPPPGHTQVWDTSLPPSASLN
ncbi:hypothetical protein FQN60_016285 [Etheostoma spectabile]|uniref:Amyloid beta A4 precursor protein-binding family B member 1-interacting protein n=1 Tax=Etheostoma spectabile TaxID=54343 RepID=A0A5J5D2T4_9PERO|nr:hypothetical protein FQN60_016285 [Etheostoma spectabile]